MIIKEEIKILNIIDFLEIKEKSEITCPDLQYTLALSYIENESTDLDCNYEAMRKADYWLCQAANQGSIKAKCKLADLFILEFTNVYFDNKEQAFKMLEKLAKENNEDAQICLANLFSITRNHKCLFWLEFFANKGNKEALSDLGFAYRAGHGVPLNLDEAIKTYKLAIKQGCIKSLASLGDLYFECKQNYKEAAYFYAEYLAKIYLQKKITPKLRLAKMFYEGKGVKKNTQIAVMFYQELAEPASYPLKKGSREAQFFLGNFYFKHNIKQAIKFYLKAAEQGCKDSKAELIKIYKKEQLYKEALVFFKKN